MSWFRRPAQSPAYDPLIRGHLIHSAEVLDTVLTDTAPADDRQADALAALKHRAATGGRRTWRWTRMLQRRERDPLTTLPNRSWLMKRTASLLDEAEGIGVPAALIVMDLDRFRAVNQTLGHPAGDRLLTKIADRLRHAVPAGADVARLGGDEFAVVLPVVGTAASAVRVARDIAASLGSPFDLDGLPLVLETSVGIAVYPDHGRDAAELLRLADLAMYQAKRDRTGVELYHPPRTTGTPNRLEALGELRGALDGHEIQVRYQPKVGFDGRVVGLEALPRWDHPQHGDLTPDELGVIAESSGLRPLLTRYTLETALDQVARWRARGLRVSVAFNTTPRDLRSPGFADLVTAALARHGLPGTALQMEITAEAFNDLPQVTAALTELTRHGVCMSLDDFGTGYSSLAQLRRLPLGELKIARSFVAEMAADHASAEIVRCSVDLARSLGLGVVAEGVEDDETWEQLRDLGCDAVQGWLVAPVMSAEETTAWLLARTHEGHTGPAPTGSPTNTPHSSA